MSHPSTGAAEPRPKLEAEEKGALMGILWYYQQNVADAFQSETIDKIVKKLDKIEP